MDDRMSKPMYGLIMGVLGALSCCGHLLIALALQRRPELKKRNKFLVSLAVSDVSIATHAFMSTWASFSNTWPFGDVGCYVDAFNGMGATFVTISTVSHIAKEKYYKECKPGKYINYSFEIKCIWILGTLGAILPFMGFGEYGYETDDPRLQTGCLLTFKYVGVKYVIYILLISILWFILPLYNILTYYEKVSHEQKGTCWQQYVVPFQLLISLAPYGLFAWLSVFYNVHFLPTYWVAINNIAAKIMIATNPFIYILADSSLYEACIEVVWGSRKDTANKKEE